MKLPAISYGELNPKRLEAGRLYMNNKNNNDYNPVGFSSILIVFVSLTLVTFTVLTLISANADYKLTQTVSTRNTAYREASNLAQLKLAEIDAQLIRLVEQNGSLSTESIMMALPSDITAEAAQGGSLVSFNEPISETQTLQIQLFVPDLPTNQTYEIRVWSVETIMASPIEEEPLNLL